MSHQPNRTTMLRALGCVVALLALSGALGAGKAGAATPGPAWEIRTVAKPSVFSSQHAAGCESNPAELPATGGNERPCDGYTITVRNSGAVASTGPVTITDNLPAAGVKFMHVGGAELHAGAFTPHELECSEPAGTLTPSCTYSEPVPADGVLVMEVNLVASGNPASVANAVTVQGGGAATASASVENSTNGEQAAFGIADYGLAVDGPNGEGEAQSAAHPYEVTAHFDLSTKLGSSGVANLLDRPVQEPRDIVAYLPMGLLGDPLAVERCPEAALRVAPGVTDCPKASIVGSATVEVHEKLVLSGVLTRATTAIYNITPDAGYPAEFGFTYLGVPVFIYASVVWDEGGYRLRVSSTGLPEEALTGVSLTFFGDPSQKSHSGASPSAFLRNPTRCSGEPRRSRLEVNSWEETRRWAAAESTTYPQVERCDMLQFNPMIAVAPETARADTPSGYEVALSVPQAQNIPGFAATPDLKNATVTLPRGVSLSPSGADGLTGCQEEGPEGIDFPHGTSHPDEAGEGEAVGPDGLSHLTAGHCPATSKIGEAEVSTPLLPAPLKGGAYVGQPLCGNAGQPPCTEASASNGELFRLYLELTGSGVVIKLKGTVQADLQTGQLVATFTENPQLPFDELKLRLAGGPRAPLANPQGCGPVIATALLEPWGGPAASSDSEFDVTGCPTGMPFAPTLTAGTVSPVADGFSPFTLTFSRQDGEQDLGGVSVHTPPGLLGEISQVPLCREPQASQGTCPSASRIGTTSVAAGSGSHPYWLSGQVYLTGTYKGEPFGLSIVVPAKAGPFNLGDEVVRAAISVDPRTSALTVTSDPLPQHRDGVPFRLKTINVTIDRPNFIFNPTNCAQQAITATISGVLSSGSPGATVPVSSPFAAAGCNKLPFRPKFSVLTQAKTSKANGAYLHVKITSGPGQANIGKVKVDLPRRLPSRLTTLQKACPDATFNANPASCPAGSLVGSATAITPVLKSPLAGPAYLVSHAGAAFPDLVIVLQGEGIALELLGNTDIKKGITISTFNTLPDAPISTFDLVLPEGPHSALGAYGSLCNSKLNMPTALTGQNGAVIRQTTRIAVSGCPKHRPRRAKVPKRGIAKRTVNSARR